MPVPASTWRDLDPFGARIAADVNTLLASIPLWLGFDMLLPGSTFAAARGWSLFAQLADENVWGFIFVVIGLIGWAGMVTSRRRLRLASRCLTCFCLAMTSAAFAIGSPSSAGTGVFALIAWLGGRLIWLTARHERG